MLSQWQWDTVLVWLFRPCGPKLSFIFFSTDLYLLTFLIILLLFPLVSVLANVLPCSACNAVLRYYALDAMGVTISLHRYRIE